MVVASKAVVPTISDQSTALQLTNFTKKLATALTDLEAAATKVNCFKSLKLLSQNL